MNNADYTAEAEQLFLEFAKRHGLHFEPDLDIPTDLCWTFPVQPGLSMPITLGLQNLDDLNFGVGHFWSHFFPFDAVASEFEAIIDAWAEGNARVVMTGRASGVLEVREGEGWKTVYRANGRLLPLNRTPKEVLFNEDLRSRA